MKEDRDELAALTKEIQQLDLNIGMEKQKMQQYSQMKRILDEHLSKMNSAKACLESTSYHQKVEKKETLELEIGTKKKEIVELEKDLESSKEKHAELTAKNQANNKEDEKENELKIIETKKKYIEKHHKSINQFQKEYESIKLELNVLNTEITGYQEDIKKINETLEDLKKQSNETHEKIVHLQVMNALGDWK